MTTPPDIQAERGEDELVEAVLVPPRGLVATILVMMTLVATAAVLRPKPSAAPPQPDLALTFWTEGASELHQRRERSAAAPSPGADEIDAALGVWLAREATEGMNALAARPDARRQLAALEERVRAYGLKHGSGALKKAAQRWSRRVRAAVERDLLGSKPSATAKLAPGLLPRLRRSGVLRWRQGARLHPAAALVIEALAESRYLQLARRMPTPRPALSSRMQRLLKRFQVEAHGGLSLQRKLNVAEELAQLDPAWPQTYVTAVLLARAGRYQAAEAWFERSAGARQQASRARNTARWCRAQRRLNPGQ